MSQKKFIVAHNRDRDYYQLAGALAEVGRLECLVTDYYSTGSGRGLHKRLSHRSSPLISAELTCGIPATVVMQALRHRIEPAGIDVIHQVNRMIGRRTRSLARARPGADLLLYSTYAAEAFEDPALKDRRKCLFMFHPHPTLIHEILAPDIASSGIGASGLAEETGVAHRLRVLDRELAAADLVFCASSLTQRSVIRAGVPEEKTRVVPYGIARPMPPYRNLRRPDRLRFLFVGQAIHRKGVHHLLDAWRRGRPEGADLIMVCSRAQDGLLDNLPEGVEVKSGLSNQELWDEYCRSHCFVLPALLEGFGLVLLEAASAGCYTLFSENTGFADVGLPDTAGRQVPSGDPSALIDAFGETAALFREKRLDHDAIHTLSKSMSAEQFRARIREELDG